MFPLLFSLSCVCGGGGGGGEWAREAERGGGYFVTFRHL